MHQSSSHIKRPLLQVHSNSKQAPTPSPTSTQKVAVPSDHYCAHHGCLANPPARPGKAHATPCRFSPMRTLQQLPHPHDSKPRPFAHLVCLSIAAPSSHARYAALSHGHAHSLATFPPSNLTFDHSNHQPIPIPQRATSASCVPHQPASLCCVVDNPCT